MIQNSTQHQIPTRMGHKNSSKRWREHALRGGWGKAGRHHVMLKLGHKGQVGFGASKDARRCFRWRDHPEQKHRGRKTSVLRNPVCPKFRSDVKRGGKGRLGA